MLGEDLFTPTGGVIGDYSLLLEYLKKCRERGLDCSTILPSSSILGEIQCIIEHRSTRFIELVEYLQSIHGKNINCDVCVEAFQQLYGVKPSCEEAIKMLITQLTSWYLEILERLGYVKIKQAWRP